MGTEMSCLRESFAPLRLGDRLAKLPEVVALLLACSHCNVGEDAVLHRLKECRFNHLLERHKRRGVGDLEECVPRMALRKRIPKVRVVLDGELQASFVEDLKRGDPVPQLLVDMLKGRDGVLRGVHCD